MAYNIIVYMSKFFKKSFLKFKDGNVTGSVRQTDRQTKASRLYGRTDRRHTDFNQRISVWFSALVS